MSGTVVTETPAEPARVQRRARRPLGLVGGLVVAAAGLVVVCFVSIALGSRSITPATVLDAFLAFDPMSTDHTVIRDMRVPRTILGLAAGTALALSGALLQGVTRNPLADPGVMGLNAGAAMAIVVAILTLGVQTASGYVWFAFAGAGIATVIVYTVASTGREGATPVKLALAGVAVAAVFSSLSSAVLLTNVEVLQEMRIWQVGALAGRYAPVLEQLAPYFLVGSIAALVMGRALNGLALGDDVAVSLGQRVRGTRAVAFVVVAVLCGAATAACGPIVFVGLVIPHVARLICGPDYRWVLAYSAVLGPLLLLCCDIVGRLVVAPGELQLGVVIGVLGAPVFIALVRYRNAIAM